MVGRVWATKYGLLLAVPSLLMLSLAAVAVLLFGGDIAIRASRAGAEGIPYVKSVTSQSWFGDAALAAVLMIVGLWSGMLVIAGRARAYDIRIGHTNGDATDMEYQVPEPAAVRWRGAGGTLRNVLMRGQRGLVVEASATDLNADTIVHDPRPLAPVLAEPRLFFSNPGCLEFGHGGKGNFVGLDPVKYYASVGADCNADGEMAITRIALVIDNQEIPAVGWNTFEVGGGQTYWLLFRIELAQSVGAGKHSANIVAFANGTSWRSPEFTIDVPNGQRDDTIEPSEQNKAKLEAAKETKKTATENSTVNYYIDKQDNSTHIYIYYNAPPNDAVMPAVEPTETFIRFRPGGEILDSSNISSVTDGGFGDFQIVFVEDLNLATLVVHAIGSAPSNFQVKDAAVGSVRIIFEDGEPEIIALRFDD